MSRDYQCTAWALFLFWSSCSPSGTTSERPGAALGVDAGHPPSEASDSGATGECIGTAADCIDASGIEGDIHWIASERVPGGTHWQAVQDECAERFETLGFEVERQSYGTGVNVIGTKHGLAPQKQILVSAHYDHIEDCSGAADNAAGLAAVWEIARVFAETAHDNTLVVACWDEEESGLVGSKAFAEQIQSSEGALPIELVYSFDSFGYTDPSPDSQSLPVGFDLLFPETADNITSRDMRGDFLAAFGDSGAAEALAMIEEYAEDAGLPTETLVLSDELKSSFLTEDLRRSDHASFWSIDVPAIHLNDTANFRNPNYHCKNGGDEPATVDLAFVTTGTKAVAHALDQQLDTD